MGNGATVICIKWGDKFAAYHVNRLYAGVARHIDRPLRFVCFTEKPKGIRKEVEVFGLPKVPFEKRMVEAMTTGKRRGAWRKVTMMQPGQAKLSGPTLIMDLDVVVTGPLGPLFDHAPGKIAMGRDWLERRRMRVGGHGSVIALRPEAAPLSLRRFRQRHRGVARLEGRAEIHFDDRATPMATSPISPTAGSARSSARRSRPSRSISCSSRDCRPTAG